MGAPVLPVGRDVRHVGQLGQGARSRAVERHLEDLRQVHRLAIGGLGDLLAATEAVGDDEGVLIGAARTVGSSTRSPHVIDTS